MAVSRRSSQHQQSTLQPSPRNAAIASPPPESPSAIIPDSPSLLSPSATVAAECGGATTTETAAASASSSERPSPAATDGALGSSSCSSISSCATAGSQSPGSGTTSPGEGVCGAGGAFRELFEACRNGDVSRVKRLVDSVNVNAKDMAGRKSTPLHFAAGMCVLFSCQIQGCRDISLSLHDVCASTISRLRYYLDIYPNVYERNKGKPIFLFCVLSVIWLMNHT